MMERGCQRMNYSSLSTVGVGGGGVREGAAMTGRGVQEGELLVTVYYRGGVKSEERRRYDGSGGVRG